jgi:hypothetical protein
MVNSLQPPEVVRCYFDDAFTPRLPAMCLRWSEDDERHWQLPEGINIEGSAPGHFGVTIHRQGKDSYAVRLLWNRTCFHWPTLTRQELLNSDLQPLLGAIGTDVWYLLDQPLRQATDPPLAA